MSSVQPVPLVWQYYPRSHALPGHLVDVVTAFEPVRVEMDSNTHAGLKSNDALAIVRPQLERHGYRVEQPNEKVRVPVLYGENGSPEKTYEVDALSSDGQTVVEVEAGTGVANNGYLKDLFQACLLPDVRYLVVAMRQVYQASRDYEKVCVAFDTLYATTRFSLPLNGVLVLGY